MRRGRAAVIRLGGCLAIGHTGAMNLSSDCIGVDASKLLSRRQAKRRPTLRGVSLRHIPSPEALIEERIGPMEPGLLGAFHPGHRRPNLRVHEQT